MILVSGPLIAQLCFRTGKWAHEAITRGRFGSAVEQRGVLFVQLDRVEDGLGRIFSEGQILAATEGRPDRIITVITEENDDGSAAGVDPKTSSATRA